MINELRLASRSLARSPGYAAVVIVTLALGIGTAAALYSSLARGFRPYDYPQMDRLVRLEELNRDSTYTSGTYLIRHLAYREHSQSYATLTGMTYDTLNLVVNGEPDGVTVSRVTPNFFMMLGAAPLLGRTFRPGEDEAGADAVAVLTHRLWRDRFGSDPAIVGTTIRLNERTYEVIGVLAEDFRTPPNMPGSRLYLPYVMPSVATPQTTFTQVFTLARLKPGVTREQAEAEARTLTLALSPSMAEYMKRYEPVVTAIDRQSENPGYQRYRAMRLTAIAAVCGLYLIACVNAGGLMLVRAIGRRQEVGVRLALGAGRWEVARPLLAEAIVLAVLAIGLGFLIARWLLPAVLAIAPGSEENMFRTLALDGSTLVFLALLGLLTGLLVASGPAWRTAGLNVNEALKDNTKGAGESRRMRAVRSGLIVLEIALAVALLTGTGLMIRTFQRLQDYQPGFATENRFRINLTLSREEQLPSKERVERYRQVVERLQQVPGVTGVSMSGWFSPTQYNAQKIRIDGQTEAGEIDAQGTSVAPDFLDLLGVPLRAGRPLAELRQGDAPSVVITESFARLHFPGRNPVGERLEISPRDKWEIIGVVGDVRSARQEPKPRFFYPYWQPRGGSNFQPVVHTAVPPGPKFNGDLRRAIYEVEPKFAVVTIQPLDQPLRSEVYVEQFTMVVLEVLAVLALSLALLGVFAMITYTVTQRRMEFGIRLTFGATPASIRRLVIVGGLKLAAVGVAIGLGLAWALSRLMAVMLYQTSGHEPLVYTGVGALMLLVSLPACWWPARRARQVDVVRLLRAE